MRPDIEAIKKRAINNGKGRIKYRPNGELDILNNSFISGLNEGSFDIPALLAYIEELEAR